MAGALVVVLVGVMVLLSGTRAAAPEHPAVAVAEPAPPLTAPAPRRARARLPGDTDTDGTATFRPETPEEEALHAVAVAAGAGVVECPVPDGAPAELQHAFARSVRRGDTVVAMVAEPEGVASIYPPKPTVEQFQADPDAALRVFQASTVALGAWRWGEAWPGEEGWCVLDSTSGDRSTDPPERVAAEWAAHRSTSELADAIEAENERDARMPSPVAVALEGELSDEARAVLQGWLAQERRAFEATRTLVDILDGAVEPPVVIEATDLVPPPSGGGEAR